ncbi:MULTISPECIES: glutamate--tRNA ligase [Variovorax]|jgi:glutamyl-tRNA synthetase|uniref:glutamate--tRNA ligase n=1 Tax=Variovorax TaxID=34072 RepID=UPI00086DC451|nr:MULTISPECIES: glutamate--tRNA ligase [Variovorax]MBN8757832.1 glutamate--tRNA ligase [Variovorax sp.]ODU18041.1 MAG: glutamate--tRNA ligase [Variovorax sp. SCN 67-85]ODV24575.1 MAG: glutamate--tRNA ligase [Variovorax sp. SCN 67-20]OJZ13485.1 MAG: glutamate--tRNA ligase [Variovorax sp. 67-131]UKI06132.1 glutamate--tRNA ligase [Variovorax paradoxus]
MTGKVRTRIAPSPTGFLHLGTARTALYSWAYARHYGGEFVLRIEDTDVARSTQDSTDQILASMHWLGLEYDEGPIYQMQRLERYREVIAQMLAAGTAYHCYCTPAELDEMREAQRARGEKTLYDRRWRPEPGKVLPPVPEGVPPVVRFCNPPEGDVTWNDLVKGEITINNREIDDLIILRPDGVPTYNFAVVVDDWDMNITHVFRGDEHINNTPWQINIFRALGAPLPQFGHVPVILGDDGQKLSKRRGAVSVTAYEENGYLPEAMLNYLARLGWSHGDDELFTREQMVSWFDGSHLSKSPAQWDAAKLAWVNAQYIKARSGEELAPLVAAQLQKKGIVADERLPAICALFKDRCDTTVALANWAAAFYADISVTEEDRAQHITEAVKPAIATLAEKLITATWDKASISAMIKEVLAAHSMKMPVLAMPVRVLVMGTSQTPSLDSVLEIFSKEKVIERLRKA